MNNIQEDDWGEDSWSRHSGMWVSKEGEKEECESSDEFEPQRNFEK